MEHPRGMEPDSDIQYPEWQTRYKEALVELDKDRLQERISAAETAIFTRLHAISGVPGYQAERQAIEDALAFLRILERDSV